MHTFFDDNKFRDAIKNYQHMISEKPKSNEFEKHRDYYIDFILGSMFDNSRLWDERTPFNRRYIFEGFSRRIYEAVALESSINDVYSCLLRFFIEEYLSNPSSTHREYQAIRDFSRDNLQEFDGASSSQIYYALFEMTTSIFKDIMNGEDFSSLNELRGLKVSIEKMQGEWDEGIDKKKQKIEGLHVEWEAELDEKAERVRQLQETLTNQRNAFNFVGLFRGFESLGEIKRRQSNWALFFLVLLGFLMPLVVCIEVYVFYGQDREVKSLYDFAFLLPAASLTLVLVYYFRIALGNYNSIRSQIMQIDLRKSLCQFIQNYAEYSSTIKSKDSNLLDKFENIIFSNIMSSDDKVPSTFDGIDQISNLIGSLKGKAK